MDFSTSNWLGCAGLATLAAVCVGVILTRLGRLPTPAERAAAEDTARAELEALPRCPCGEVATDPLPILKRDRGAWDWLRTIFAAPPRYKRVIDAMGAPAVCRTHAHVADAMMDQFIFRVRGAYSDLNTKVATDAAAFEQEGLARQIGETLTAQQRRATRRPGTVQLLTHTATGDGAGA